MTPKTSFPHPRDIAARQVLARRPRPSLQKVMQQAESSEAWRRKSGSATGLKKPAA